ncbi:reverse transcriptase domain-containing protein [Tanacetum coccineum]
MEKLALALVHAAKRLRRYFQAHPIKVITDNPIRKVLNNLGASGRLAKWAVELGAYGITYVPRVAVKGQDLADVLADTSTEMNATPEVANTPRMKDIPESSNARENPRAENMKADAFRKLAAVQFDHLSKEVLVEVLNERFVEAQEVNMVVEEEGSTWMTPIQIYLDNGILPKDPVDVRTLMEKIRNYTMKDGVLYMKSYLIPLMSWQRFNSTLIQRSTSKGVNERSVEAQEVNMVVEEEGPTWMTPIRNYLEKGKLPEDPVDARTLMEKIGNYTMDYLVPLMRFGIPATIITDNRTQFVNDPFKKWAEKLKIQLISTSVYYPQENGAVERANKSLLRGIKTRLEKGGSAWAEESP